MSAEGSAGMTELRLEEQIGGRATWLVTGSAGFIGSHLLEELLKANQAVISIDNFSTGHRRNLEEVRDSVGEAAWKSHVFVEGDITHLKTCQGLVRNVDFVLHQAALGSVPRSIKDPLSSNASNVTGFLNLLTAAKDERIKRFVFASSSSVYGDHPDLPKVETRTGKLLSPYAATKAVDELYAEVFSRTYPVSTVGLRYFNVFGSRQDPDGPYAAVIPRWVKALLNEQPITVNGDGSTSRDFCYVKNVVLANVLSATSPLDEIGFRVFNVAVGQRTTLLELLEQLYRQLVELTSDIRRPAIEFKEFRQGDVRHSLADISAARTALGYVPYFDLITGLRHALPWYVRASKGH